jgi:hypothetical protein
VKSEPISSPQIQCQVTRCELRGTSSGEDVTPSQSAPETQAAACDTRSQHWVEAAPATGGNGIVALCQRQSVRALIEASLAD